MSTKLAPIGTIAPWLPRVDKTLDEIRPIPEGWQYCNGSYITDGPWSGMRTPDLNGLFLRGGDVDSVLEMEDSQLEDHEHEDGGHSHSCSASSTAAPHSHHFDTNRVWSDQAFDCVGNCRANLDRADGSTKSATVSVTTTCSLSSHDSNMGGVSSGANAGSETRPANMKVQYIIRVV